jgi:hypothetical protein
MRSKTIPFLFLLALCLYACPYTAGTVSMMTASQIATGLNQGLAALPYYALADTELEEINPQFEKIGAEFTLVDTYRAAYGINFAEVPANGDTGQAFSTMQEATVNLHKILNDHNVPNAENYIMTSIDTANDQGYTLFAVVYRPDRGIAIVDKYDKKTIRRLNRNNLLYYQPFRYDINRRPLDAIVDWAGIPVSSYAKQKYQAIMLTLAANKIVEGPTRLDYWEAEEQWIAGEFGAICYTQDQKTCSILGIKKGFTRP